MRRRILFLIAALLAGMGLFLATLPLWLGSAVRTFGPSRGLTVGGYERVGYSRFVLHDVEYRRPGVRVTLKKAEADTPVLWAWRHWLRRDAAIVGGSWEVEITPTTNSAPKAPADRGWLPLRDLLQRIATQLDRWLPEAKVGAGVVRFPQGEIALASAQWEKKQLVARGLTFRRLAVDAEVAFGPAGELRLAARTLKDAAVPLALKADARGPDLTAEMSVMEQPATLKATFAPRGWLPTDATVLASEWVLAAQKLRLGPLYSQVRGAAQIHWHEEKLSANLEAKAEPVPGKSAPPLGLALHGNGDLEQFTVTTLNATLPGAAARLSEPVTIERTGKIRAGAARFTLDVDLAQQPWFTAKGIAKGEARVVSNLDAAPVVEFSFTARDLSARDVSLSAVDARGKFVWPRIEIASGVIVGGAGERITWHGAWDLSAKELVDASAEGQLRRTSVARWLPPEPTFEVIDFNVQAAGPVATLNHSGRLRVDQVQAKGVKLFKLAADWKGIGAALDEVNVNADTEVTHVHAKASVERTGLRLTEFTFTENREKRLQLAAPAVIRWSPQLEIESLHLAGGNSLLKVSAVRGDAGRVELAARSIPSGWLADLLNYTGPVWELSSLAVTGAWERGPMTFSMTVGAKLEIAEGRSAEVAVAARGDKNGVNVEAVRATESGSTVVNAVGNVPVIFTPASSELMHIDPAGALRVDATVAPNAAFWQKLAAVSGVELVDPQASVHLAGTWQRPEGAAQLKAAHVAIDPKKFPRPLPKLEALEIQLTGGREGVTLKTFSVAVEGQALRAQGKLPVPDGKWSALFKEPLAAAKNDADLRIEVPDADLAVFARFLPTVLAPKGRVQADVQYRRGGVEGFVKLRDAASRPLGPLGVLQEISADVALSGRKVALRGVTARSGGQPVTLAGTIEFPEKEAPRYDLTLKGENLPFVRKTGLLMRGDLDLKLQTPTNAPPRLSGSVRLRDSLFLSDVRAFLPKGGGASPARRPPYFAVEATPVNVWQLAVDVSGTDFLRLRTPVFTGVASARFRLTGTLGEPRAVGEVSITDGMVRMPFASLAVTQGAIRLTEADPYEPSVYLRATGRRYGYDLTMEIDGSATQPSIVFTTSPSLDSEQVLLMVMTGAAPSNEIGKSATTRVANLGLFLSQSLLGSIGSDAADADRLSFAAGEKISRQGKETYDVEYKLSDRWTVVGEYNEFDEVNAGVKWRVFGGRRAREGTGNANK